MLIMTAAASTTTTTQVNFMPQYIYFVAATLPTRLTISPLGGSPVVDLDANGVTAMRNQRNFAIPLNGCLIPCANGVIKNKTTEIIFTNALASAVSVYGFGFESGDTYIQCFGNTILAGNPQTFTDFHSIGCPSAAASDLYDITYVDGTTHRYTHTELLAIVGMTQGDVANYLIDNWEQKIKSVIITPAATQKVYICRSVSAVGVAGGL